MFAWARGPERRTGQLLDTLSLHGVQAAFFVVGNRISTHRAILQRAVSEGHFVAHHSHTHSDLTRMSLGSVRDEVINAASAIQSAACVRPRVLRPPYGAISGAALEMVQDMGYLVVNWNMDTQDWTLGQGASPSSVYATVADTMDDLYPGSIIHLQHDLIQESVDTVGHVIDMVKAKGYRIVSLPECLYGAAAWEGAYSFRACARPHRA